MKADKERINSILGEGGKFLLDIAKLIIGGVLLAGIMKEDLDKAVLYGLGAVFVIFLTIFGFYFLWLSKSKTKK